MIGVEMSGVLVSELIGGSVELVTTSVGAVVSGMVSVSVGAGELIGTGNVKKGCLAVPFVFFPNGGPKMGDLVSRASSLSSSSSSSCFFHRKLNAFPMSSGGCRGKRKRLGGLLRLFSIALYHVGGRVEITTAHNGDQRVEPQAIWE